MWYLLIYGFKKMIFFRLLLKKDSSALSLIRPLFNVIFKNVSRNIFRILFLPYRLTIPTPTHTTKILCSQESSGWVRQKKTLSWDLKATLLKWQVCPTLPLCLTEVLTMAAFFMGPHSLWTLNTLSPSTSHSNLRTIEF